MPIILFIGLTIGEQKNHTIRKDIVISILIAIVIYLPFIYFCITHRNIINKYINIKTNVILEMRKVSNSPSTMVQEIG